MKNRAARFVTENYTFETGSMTKSFEQLKGEILKRRRKDSELFYIGLKDQARIPVGDLQTPLRLTRNQHSKSFSTPICQDRYL